MRSIPVSPYEGIHKQGVHGAPHVLADCSWDYCGRESGVTGAELGLPEHEAFDDAPEGDLDTFDLAEEIIRYEDGELDHDKTLVLFANLIASGLAWSLQGSYGRAAFELINRGVISEDGDIDWDKAEEVYGL